MRTLHFGLRVADLERAVEFYTALGYQVIGRVPETPLGSLTMLQLPGDEFVSIELVHDPARDSGGVATGLSHFVITVESMADTLAGLAGRGLEPAEAPSSPDGTDDFLTAWLTDPDGNRIELVQWPAGHAGGLSAADWSG